MQFVVKYCAKVQCLVFMLFLYNKPTFNMQISTMTFIAYSSFKCQITFWGHCTLKFNS